MTGLRRALIASALAFPLGLLAAGAQAQNGPNGPGPGYGRGYGPGMMGGGYGPGMMWGGGTGYGPGMMWGGGNGYGPGMMWRWHGGRWTADPSSAEGLTEGRLAFLKAELKITAQQEPLWDKYAEAARANAKEMYERHKTLLESVQSDEALPQRLDQREQIMALNLDAMRKTDAALKPLYAALDDNQRKLADDLLPSGMMF